MKMSEMIQKRFVRVHFLYLQKDGNMRRKIRNTN